MVKEWFGIIGGNAITITGAILATISAEDFRLWGCACIGLIVAAASGYSTILKNRALRLEAQVRKEREELLKVPVKVQAIIDYYRLCEYCRGRQEPIKNCGNKYPPKDCRGKK